MRESPQPLTGVLPEMFKTLTAITATLIFAGSATADLVNPLVPSWAGGPGATSAQWDSFTSADGGANAPESGSGFNLYNFGTGAIIASSGNLYGAGGALNIHVYPAGPPILGLAEAVVNISFAGNPIDTDNVRALVGDQATGTFVDSVSTFQGGGGSSFSPQTWSFEFDFSAFSFGPPQSLSFFFGSELANSSLDAISIDVLGAPIPAPGALMALGLLGVARRRRG
jgi:hypothetical protein